MNGTKAFMKVSNLFKKPEIIHPPDCHALWVKEGMEQSLEIFGPSIKLKRDVHCRPTSYMYLSGKDA